MDMAVDERRRDERAIQVDDLGVAELSASDVVAAQPRDNTVADGHRGGVGVGRAVYPAPDKQLRHRGSAGGSKSWTSTTSPSM